MTQEMQVLEKSVMPIVNKAKAVIIKTGENYKEASEFALYLKNLKTKIIDFMGPMKTKAHEAHKEICNKEKTMLRPINEAETINDLKMAKYLEIEEKKRRDKEDRLNRIAKEKADKEAQKKVEDAEARGEFEKVEEIKEEYAEPAPVIVPNVIPKTGVSGKKVWKWRLKKVDGVKREFMKIDEIAIGAAVRAMGKRAEAVVGGIETYQEMQMQKRTLRR